MTGQYDETESAQSFQDALSAWRTAKSANKQGKPSMDNKQPISKEYTPRGKNKGTT